MGSAMGGGGGVGGGGVIGCSAMGGGGGGGVGAAMGGGGGGGGGGAPTGSWARAEAATSKRGEPTLTRRASFVIDRIRNLTSVNAASTRSLRRSAC